MADGTPLGLAPRRSLIATGRCTQLARRFPRLMTGRRLLSADEPPAVVAATNRDFEVRITVSLDTTELVDRMDRAAADMVRGLRSAVDKTARSARRQTIAEAARDEGVTVREAAKGQPLVKGSTQFSLSASWTVKPTFVNILRTSGASLERGNGLHASTFRITGGRSASLSAPNAFHLSVANADGGLAFVRTRHGKGTHRGGGIRAISAEMTRTAMGQADGAARRLWQRVADRELRIAANAAVQRALDGAGASLDRGFD